MAKDDFDTFGDKKKLQPIEEAISEAIYWKREVLNYHRTATTIGGAYYTVSSLEDKLRIHSLFQGAVIRLFSKLKTMIKKLDSKKKEKKKRLENIFGKLEEFRNIREEYKNDRKGKKILSIPYLNRCLDVLTDVIEEIGITKIEKRKFPEEESMA